jgi:hypothetical protein
VSIPIPLSVRLLTSRSDRHVTSELRDLTFREVANGGYASATISLNRPISLQPDEVAQYGQVFVYDARNGNTVWEGRLEDPDRSADNGGPAWHITAVGPSAHTQDRARPIVYVDKRITPYVRVENVTPGADFSTGVDPGQAGSTLPVDQSLVYQFPQGLGLVTNSRVAGRYDLLRLFGQKLARYDYTWDAGRTLATLAEVSRTQTFNVAGAGASPKVHVTDYPAGRNTLDLRILYTGGAVTIGDDVTWASITEPVVVATRYDKTGAELLTAASYTTSTVLASDVVADLLGRLLPDYDGVNATITPTTYAIDQLVYEDGATPQRILEDLLVFEPNMRWGAYETVPSSGKYRFEFVAWPTTVRYEAEIFDGFSSPGSADGLYNEVNVRWKDAAGNVKFTTRTAAVTALTDAGLTRSGFLDLGDEVGSVTNAQQAGDKWLIEHGVAPNAGSLTVARPLTDLVTGMPVMPWEIRPGNLIRVRGVQARVDALNATDRDGQTVFRIASREYQAGSAAATLELDSYALTTARALATLAAKPTALRR